MIGTHSSALVSRMCRADSYPSMIGITTSMSTRPGRSWRYKCSACSPSFASTTVWPMRSSRPLSAARIVGESSTTRIFIATRAPRLRLDVQGYNYFTLDPAWTRPPARFSAGRVQQDADIGCEVGCVAVAHEQAQPPLRIEHVAARGVIHGVAVRCLSRRLLIENPEVFRDPGGRSGIAVEPEKTGVECRYVVCEKFLRVALRVDGDEEHLQPLPVLAELIFYRFELGKCRRTYVGAAGVAEEHHYRLAAEIGKSARLARVVGEGKILAVIGARDVGVLERWARPAAAGKRECGEDKPGHCPQVSAHAKK